MNASPDPDDPTWTDGPWELPELRTSDDLTTDRATSARQLDGIRKRDPSSITKLLNSMRAGRSARADLVQFEVVTKDERPPLLFAAGELVVRTEVLDASPSLQSALTDGGFTQAPVPADLDDRVRRFISPGMSRDDIERFAAEQREQGHRVSVNHIAPLGYWVKSEEGPAPTSWTQPPPPPPPQARPIVAVIDTGIVVAGKRTDRWLDEVVRDPDPTTGNVDLLDGPDPLDELDLGAGHGTFASGIIRQVAPDAEIRAVRALDPTGLGTDVEVAAAMVRAVRAGARILNLSLGIQTLDGDAPVAIDVALDLIDAEPGGDEVLIVAAAGNFGDTEHCWPAAFDRVVSVAALTAEGLPAAWSSHGPWVDCSTVGEGVVSPYVPGTESAAMDATPDTFGSADWAMWAGTSFAAPQVAGLAARLVAEKGLSPRGAAAEIIRSGYEITGYGQAVRILPGTLDTPVTTTTS